VVGFDNAGGTEPLSGGVVIGRAAFACTHILTLTTSGCLPAGNRPGLAMLQVRRSRAGSGPPAGARVVLVQGRPAMETELSVGAGEKPKPSMLISYVFGVKCLGLGFGKEVDEEFRAV